MTQKDLIISKQDELIALLENKMQWWSMTNDYMKLSDELSALKSEPEASKDEELREALIKFACRNDKYNLTNIKNSEVPMFLEMCRKDHEISVDQYFNSLRNDK
jgi:hypothetical protein